MTEIPDATRRLHTMKTGPNEWFACVHPERPDEPSRTWYDERCRACVIALGAAAVHDCGATVMYDEHGERKDTYRAQYERLRHEFDLPPLPEPAR